MDHKNIAVLPSPLFSDSWYLMAPGKFFGIGPGKTYSFRSLSEALNKAKELKLNFWFRNRKVLFVRYDDMGKVLDRHFIDVSSDSAILQVVLTHG